MAAVEQYKQKFLVWFLALSESEQKLLKVAGGFFAIFILFSVFTSLNNGVSEAERKLRQQTELNTWAEQQIAIIKQAEKGGAINKGAQRSMTQVINSTARKLKITIERIQPQKDDLVKVGIDEIGFNTLITWLQELESQHNISAKNIDFSKADASGVVKIRRLDLERI